MVVAFLLLLSMVAPAQSPSDAAEVYQQRVTRHPDDGEGWYQLGVCRRQLRQYREAMLALERASALHVRPGQTENLLGLTYWEMGRYGDARLSYLQAIALKPDFAAPHIGIGVVLTYQGDYAEAVAELDRGISLEGTPDASDYNALGYAYLRWGHYETAAEAYQKAVKLDPALEQAQNGLGFVLLALERYSEAAKTFRNALKQDPNNIKIEANLGVCYERMGQHDRAISTFKACLDLHPQDFEEWNARAVCLRYLDRKPEAIETYKKVIGMAPMFAEAHLDLGMVYTDDGRLDLARDEAQTLRTLNHAAWADRLDDYIKAHL